MSKFFGFMLTFLRQMVASTTVVDFILSRDFEPATFYCKLGLSLPDWGMVMGFQVRHEYSNPKTQLQWVCLDFWGFGFELGLLTFGLGLS